MTKQRWLRGGRLLDPVKGRDEIADLALAEGHIVGVGAPPAGFQPDEVMDVTGCIVCPAWVETSFQAHSPGHGRDGSLMTELRAAAAGGVGTVLLSPDTQPIADQPGVLRDQQIQAQACGLQRVLCSGALTPGLAGRALTEMAALQDAGAVALSQGVHGIADAGLLRQALTYAADLNLPVFLHPEDGALAADGLMHEGAMSLRLGLAGRPGAAELVGVHRDLAVAELAGARVHFPHLGMARALDAVTVARAQGLPVTAGVSIHQLLLTEQDIGYFNVHAKVLPVLGDAANRDALLQAVYRGEIQCLSSQHTPWGVEREGMTFAQAPFGIAAVEWLLPLGLRLVEQGALSLMALVQLLSAGPAGVLGLEKPSLEPGAPADLCVFDPLAPMTVPRRGWSAGNNHPYAGWELTGQVRYTLCSGRMIYRGMA